MVSRKDFFDTQTCTVEVIRKVQRDYCSVDAVCQIWGPSANRRFCSPCCADMQGSLMTCFLVQDVKHSWPVA